MKSPVEWTSGDGLVSRVLLEQPPSEGLDVAAGDAQCCDVAPGSVCRLQVRVEQVASVDLSDTAVSQWLAGVSKSVAESASEAADSGRDGECAVDVEIGEADTEVDRLLEACLLSLRAGDRCRAQLRLRTDRLPGVWAEDRLQLSCMLTVVSVRGGQHHETLTPPEMLTQADRHRLHGNRLFTAGRVVDAFFQYKQALSLLVYIPPVEDVDLQGRVAAARVACRSNIAACQLSRSRWEAARDAADRVLQECPDHVRCLYRRGAAHLQLQDLEKAAADLQRVLQLQPGDRAATDQLATLKRKQKQLDQHTANYMTKFLGLQ